jgi:hypothetical protein
LVLTYKALNGYSKLISMNETFLTQTWFPFGGTDPIVIPTPNITFTFWTKISSEQPFLATLHDLSQGLTATASSKLVMLTFLIVTFEPRGSIPSVFTGKSGHDSSVFGPIKYFAMLEYSPKKWMKRLYANSST